MNKHNRWLVAAKQRCRETQTCVLLCCVSAGCGSAEDAGMVISWDGGAVPAAATDARDESCQNKGRGAAKQRATDYIKTSFIPTQERNRIIKRAFLRAKAAFTLLRKQTKDGGATLKVHLHRSGTAAHRWNTDTHYTDNPPRPASAREKEGMFTG